MHRFGTVKRQSTDPRVGPGVDDEVIFELPLVAIVADVDTVVDVGLLDCTVLADVSDPILTGVANQVVASA